MKERLTQEAERGCGLEDLIVLFQMPLAENENGNQKIQNNLKNIDSQTYITLHEIHLLTVNFGVVCAPKQVVNGTVEVVGNAGKV